MNRAGSRPVDDLGSAAQRDRRRRILDATVALASEGGFESVQMRAVAEHADVALGTLYRYFPSKIHLLVSALQREFEEAAAAECSRPVEGATAADRVVTLLRRTSRQMQRDPRLTEALTRAFMFADSSVTPEIRRAGSLLTSMLTHAMRPDVAAADVADEDVQVARVIGDVWLSTLVGWVTGRTTAADTGRRLEVAVRLLLRD